MRKEFLTKLEEEYGEIKLFDTKFGDWVLLNLSPLPPKGEIEWVVHDITMGNAVRIIGGQIRHLEKCKELDHNIDMQIAKCLSYLKAENFRVAINLKEEAPLYQPLAISLDPLISFNKYPDHPHINDDLEHTDMAKAGVKLPESICYIANACELGDTYEDRLFAAIGIIVIWLFRHQLWLASRKIYGRGKGIWIGEHIPYFDEPGCYVEHINPYGSCRCGSDKSYMVCCMNGDSHSLRKMGIRSLPFEIANTRRQSTIHDLRASFHI